MFPETKSRETLRFEKTRGRPIGGGGRGLLLVLNQLATSQLMETIMEMNMPSFSVHVAP